MSASLSLPDPAAVYAQLQAWAQAQPAVRALLLTSTRARPAPAGDALSDYDVIVVAGDIRPFHADRAWIAAFGPVLVTYWDPLITDPATGHLTFGNVIQYETGLKIDFTLWPVAYLAHLIQTAALPAELDAGYRVLFDQDGLAARLAPPTYHAYAPAPPSAADYHRHIEEFFSDAPYVAKCLWRGELLPAKWALDYDMKHVYLRPVLEWRVALDHGWTFKIGALGKGLRRYLPPDLWAALEATYTGAVLADHWEPLLRTLALFRRVATEVGAHLGYAYPLDLDERVVRYVQQIRALPPPAA